MSMNEHVSSASRQSLASLPGLFNLRARAWAAWKRHRNERVLENLSYDTLKDIGFPSVDDAAHKTEQ
ncbi:hypothetical protein GOC91_23470 [Sinorhizobium medicae]|uniref:DUF1127 domain-containing protein n=2 Tax=Sinorhizobium medicae TaxID=110321 RepID=A0A508WVX0_9HYPH|nr:hypothetical protein [Sinorhizobium medicae]ABR60624.1 conserved hypothetical protein [Sinorhizobium medicae WSM419]MBO1944051.1 hypothetical protein [Sinorhizobium medicae]MBO1965058.1 hypothetical protein [Sinorhizobium medicae]MDX0406528.1 hypothetical protein [Sinorhizobium medicae]MDX0413079.1 hypothetical protein [Sinorhizobium medicae]